MSDLKTSLNVARQRVLAGEKLTVEEQKELLSLIRQSRVAAAEAGNSARTKRNTKAAAKKGATDEQLHSDLDSLLGD